MITEINVDVPMRDGIKLRANVWRPDAPRKYPGILIRTPYGKRAGGYERYVRAGYVVVEMDTRGRYESEGDFVVYTDERNHEADDGYDSVEWLAQQPWCNGRVGTMGASYKGWMQWALATRRPPSLRCMCACSIPLENTDVDWWGAFRPGRRMKWWLTSMAPDLRKRAGWPLPHNPAHACAIWDDIEHGRWLSLLPWIEVVKYLPPPLAQQVEDWMRHPNRKCWRFAERHQEIEVPNLDFTGWYDHCNSLGHLSGMQQHARSELARTQTKVVCGPWSHGTIGKRDCYGNDMGPEAELDIVDLEIRWFDRWLKDCRNGVDQDPAVRYFVMGSNEWQSAASWPPSGLDEYVYHLAGAGNANSVNGSGLLKDTPASEATTDSYCYDPQDPAPTLWTTKLSFGASDRRRLEHRRDILVYRTPLLEEAVEIVGEPEVVLYAATSAADTDWFARLIDDEPGGRAMEVAYGMVRARYRNSLDREELITPGKVVEYHLRLTPTACRFLKGHRIRLDITSSDFPNFDRNHNTGRNDLLDAELLPANQTVHHSADYPSRIVLPVRHVM